jgi:RND family efflux transporter MFP subunit
MRIWLLMFTALAVVSLQGCGNGGEELENLHATVVQLAEVKSKSGEQVFTFPAKVVPKSTVNLAFRVGGRLQAVHLPEGRYVRKGDLLAKLDPKPFKRAVSIAEVRLKQSELELKRVKAIATKGIGSEKSVDNALVAFELATLELEDAKSNFEYSKLRAPFNALVAKRLIENEDYIKAGSAVAHLQDFSRIHFEFDVSERLVSNYRRKQVSNASVQMGGSIDNSYAIEYVEHSTEPDPVTQTYQIVYAMDFPKGLDITPGIRATVTIKGENQGMMSVVGVPVNSVVTHSDDSLYVWLYNPETHKVAKQMVTVGPIANGWIAVLSGLEAGQKVVAAGASKMQDGMLVRPYVMQ